MKMANDRIYVNLHVTPNTGVRWLKWLALPAVLWLRLVHALFRPHFKLTVDGTNPN